jgi:hypothetical protein
MKCRMTERPQHRGTDCDENKSEDSAKAKPENDGNQQSDYARCQKTDRQRL